LDFCADSKSVAPKAEEGGDVEQIKEKLLELSLEEETDVAQGINSKKTLIRR